MAGHDLIVLLYTKTYEPSARIFQVTITLLLFTFFLSDPIVRAYAHLRNIILAIKIFNFVLLFCALFPVIHYFGMMGAAVVAVAIQISERVLTAFAAATTVNATFRHLALYHDLFKIMGLTAAAGFFAYTVRNFISPALLVSRISAVAICFALFYLPAFYFMRLPGWEVMSMERVHSFVRARLAGMKGTAVQVPRD